MARTRRTSNRRSGSHAAYQPPANDILSTAFAGADLVPDALRGVDTFLDIVTWNIRFFHDQDPDRVDRIVSILGALNADIFVLEEIKDGSLDVVAEKLGARGAGHYSVAYGSTGGQQRVAMMWDLDWIRAKDDVRELFGRGQIRSSDGRDAFPRLPLWGYFTGLRDDLEEAPFDFQLLGLHLKSQRGGGQPQRIAASEKLATWMRLDAVQQDADVIMMGDWNEKPNSDTWEAMRRLEEQGHALFQSINTTSEISHFYYRNRDNLGSRLDLAAVSIAAADQMLDRDAGATVVRWRGLDEFLSHHPSAQEIRRLISDIGKDVSDHLPVVTRFYWTENNS